MGVLCHYLITFALNQVAARANAGVKHMWETNNIDLTAGRKVTK